MNIGEMFVRLGVKADTFTVKDFGKAVGDIPFAVAGAVASLAGFSLGFIDLAKFSLDTANNLRQFHSITGLSIEEMERWEVAAQKVGAKGGEAMNAVMHISQAMAAFNTGHGDPGFMQALGLLHVDPKGKDAFAILKDALTSNAASSPANRADLLQRLGITGNLTDLNNPTQINRYLASSPPMSSGDVKELQSFQAAIVEFKNVVEGTFVHALMEVEPYLKNFADVLTDFVGLAGKSATGYGGLAKFYGDVKKEGGPLDLISNLISSYETPENLHNKEYVNKYFSQIDVHGVQDPHAVHQLIKDQHDGHMAKAHKHFNNHEKVH